MKKLIYGCMLIGAIIVAFILLGAYNLDTLTREESLPWFIVSTLVGIFALYKLNTDLHD